jgi:hypothetical protein
VAQSKVEANEREALSRKRERLAVQWFQATDGWLILGDVSFKGVRFLLDLPTILGKCRIWKTTNSAYNAASPL